MSIENMSIPKTMLDAFRQGQADGYCAEDCLLLAIESLIENPLTPTDVQAEELWHRPKVLSGQEHYAKAMARDWMRMVFVKPAYPSEIAQKLWSQGYGGISKSQAEEHNMRVIEAYEFGAKVVAK